MGRGRCRATIAAADSGDTITFAASLNHKTITLTGGELVIDKSLDVEGPGASNLTISGNSAGRVFHVSNGSDGDAGGPDHRRRGDRRRPSAAAASSTRPGPT